MPANKKKRLLVLCGWGLLASSITSAAAANETVVRGWYIGNSVGSTTPKAANFRSAQCWNFDAGYRFSSLSSELTYAYLGQFNHATAAATDVQVRGVTIAVVPRYDINSWLALEAVLGVHRWQVNSQLYGKHFGRDDGAAATFGAGAWFQIKGGVALDLRWQRYNNVSGTDLSQYALGVRYVFRR